MFNVIISYVKEFESDPKKFAIGLRERLCFYAGGIIICW